MGTKNCGQESRACGETLLLKRCWQIYEIQKPHRESEREYVQDPKETADQTGEISCGMCGFKEQIQAGKSMNREEQHFSQVANGTPKNSQGDGSAGIWGNPLVSHSPDAGLQGLSQLSVLICWQNLTVEAEPYKG